MLYKNILLIDDDSDDTALFAEAVTYLRKEIVCHTNTNALKAFEELLVTDNLPDLIFVDFNMPALNGAELIQKMKKEKRFQHIHFILMSSHSAEIMCELTQELESIPYIVKPCSFHELVTLLDGVLQADLQKINKY